MMHTAALPDPERPEQPVPDPEPASDDATHGELADGENVSAEDNPDDARDSTPASQPAVAAAAVAAPQTVRRTRADRYRPRPAITLVTFAVGVALGAAVFVSRSEPPAAPQALPESPYQSLGATNAAPFPVAVLMQGLTSSADQVPRVVPDPALGQLRRVLGEFAVVTSVEHQATIAVGNEGISAIIIRGIDRQGRTALTTLTAHLRGNRIVEFR
jgi:hypothetical protein